MGMIAIQPRLLRKADAARYCGIDPQRFARVCPVRPKDLGDRQPDSRPVLRWDVRELDAWLDSLGGSPDTLSSDDWLGKIGGDQTHGDDRAR